MAVIAHHPVIIVFKRIGSLGLAVDVDLAVLHFQGVVLVILDTTAVQRQITFVQRDGSPFLRDPKRPEVITGPAGIVSDRIGGAAQRLRLDDNLLHGR